MEILKSKNNKVLIILSCIVLLGFLLRAVKISELPMYGDELTMVYDSFSLLKTGRDQTGKLLPLTFEMGAGRPAGYVYFSIPFVALFGPSALGVRTLSLLSSLGVIVLMYFLGKKLYSKKVGLISAFIAAVSPLLLTLGRGGFEATFALFLALLGVVSFLYARKKPWMYLVFTLSWGLAIHTYPTYKLTLLLLLVPLIWFTGGFKRILSNKKEKTFVIFAVVIGIVFILPSLNQTLFGISESRFSSINIFARQDIREELVQKINYDRQISPYTGFVDVLLHNKPIEFSKLLTENYLKNLSIEYIYIDGDGNPRHNMTESGILFWAEIALIFYAVVNLWQKKKKLLFFLLSWTLIVPVASTLLAAQHSLRNSFILPPLWLISSVGLVYILEIRNKTTRYMLLSGLTIIFIWQFLLMVDRLYFISPNKHAGFWSYSAKQAVDLALENKEKFDLVILSDQIDNVEFAYPVYAEVQPDKVINQRSRKYELNGRSFLKYDNIIIGNLSGVGINDYIGSLDGSLLFVGDYDKDREFVDEDYTLNSTDTRKSLVVVEKN